MYTEEQDYWLDQMYKRCCKCISAHECLKFIEGKLGNVNATVIDFRHFIKQYDESFSEAQDKFRECGGLDAAYNALIEEDKIKENDKTTIN